MDATRHISAPDARIVLRFVSGDDPLMRRVAELCYETLHRPFGVERNDSWGEMDPESVHLVALDGERLAGYARLLFEGRWGHVRQVTVRAGYRRRGIASSLVKTLTDEARRHGSDGVYLNARRRAAGMYERLGFRVVGGTFRMPRTWLPHVRMELPLR
jgi:GNAT superfamily N-acetyltransferase